MSEEKKEEFDIKEIYTPLSVAKEEIWRRWNDKDLRKKVEDFLDGDIPNFLKDNPKAFLARQIVTPSFDILKFLKLVANLDMDFVCPEFPEDTFSAKNKVKYHLGKLFFCNGIGKNGGHKINSVKIIDFNNAEGKKIRDIKTLWGESLVTFHRKMVTSVIPDINGKIFDISPWLEKNGSIPGLFYEKFLAFFVCNGVLFENFLMDSEESDFTRGIVIPAMRKIELRFGVKPLIVRLLPSVSEDDPSWLYYPDFIGLSLENLKNKK